METMMSVHQARKDAELNSLLLSNRVKYLEKEEARNLRKIEETKRKALEVSQRQKEQEERFRQRLELSAEKQKEFNTKRDLAKQRREESKSRRKEILNTLKLIREEDFLAAKTESDKCKEKISDFWLSNYNKNIRRIKAHKTNKWYGDQKIKHFKLNRTQMTQKEYKKKIIREVDLKSKLENEVLEMEKLEFELIKKLQNTQQIQKDTYSDLKKALNRKVNRVKYANKGHTFA